MGCATGAVSRGVEGARAERESVAARRGVQSQSVLASMQLSTPLIIQAVGGCGFPGK